MGAVCDGFDAVTSNQPYKGVERSRHPGGMFSWGGHFNDYVLGALIRSIGFYRRLFGVPAFASSALILRRMPQTLSALICDFLQDHAALFDSHDDIDLLKRADERPDDWRLAGWEAMWPKLIG